MLAVALASSKRKIALARITIAAHVKTSRNPEVVNPVVAVRLPDLLVSFS